MGVRGLYDYINRIDGSWRTINIVEELQIYQREHNKQPVLIINLWTLSNQFSSDLRDILLGDRLNEIKSEFEDFLIKLRDNGAVPIFTFKKSQVHENDFILRSEADYEAGREVLDVIFVLKKSHHIIRHFAKKPEFFFPKNRAILTVLAQTAAKYGRLSGIDSIDCKPSAIHARLANQERAVAIMGTDTYYIFFGGSWKLWSDKDLHMRTMTTREYNKEFILEQMQLNIAKAPLFLALAGGLHTDRKTLKKIVHFFKPWTWAFFPNVCDYVNRQRFPFTVHTLMRIIEEIFGAPDLRILDDFKLTLDSMDPAKIKFEPTMVEACENELLNYANQMLNNRIINIPTTYMDLRYDDMTPIKDLIAPWIQKTAGILFKHRNGLNLQILMIKEKHNEPPREVEIHPIIPTFDVPVLTDLVSSQFSSEMSASMLQFVCDKSFDDIPDEHFCNIVILLHAAKLGAFKAFEAKLIMRTIVDADTGRVPRDFQYPETISERALRVSFLFSKLFFVLQSCLAAIGFKRFQSDYQFDNAHFQKLYEGDSKKDEVGADDELFDDLKSIITT